MAQLCWVSSDGKIYNSSSPNISMHHTGGHAIWTLDERINKTVDIEEEQYIDNNTIIQTTVNGIDIYIDNKSLEGWDDF